MEVTMKGILNMVLEVNQIAGKYISKLEQKKFLKVVKLNDATSAIKQAVDDAANIAKKDITDAIEPFKTRIAQKDEFITNQKNTNQILQNENEKLKQTNSTLQAELAKEKNGKQSLSTQNEQLQSDLKKTKDENFNLDIKNQNLQTALDKQNATNQNLQNKNTKLNNQNSSLQTTLEKYKSIVKEAYKQGITPEIREQKTGIANILTGLIKHKSMIATPKEEVKTIMPKATNIQAEPVIAKPKENIELVMPKTTNKKPKSVITKPEPDTIISAKAPLTKEEVISKIREERKNQVLDKKRMNIATELIKDILGDLQTYDWKGISEQYKKLNNNKKFNEIAKNNSLKISRHMGGFGYIAEGSFIRFIDPNNKDLLSINFDAMDKSIKIWIYDEKGLPMVTSKTKNGVVEELRVRFNNVKHITEPEVLYDEAFNKYAQNIIKQAKESTTSKTYTENKYDSSYKTRTVNYYTPNNINLVSEYFVNNKHVSTGIANPINGKLEKEFKIGGNGFEIIKNRKSNVYGIDGISSITKYKQDNEIFSINYNLYPENRRVGSQYLYETKDGNKNPHQKLAYEKNNLGLINHPLTSGFSYYDLTKHGIKPWDFSMLNNYIK